MVKIKGDQILYLFVAFIVCVAIIALAGSITYHVIHEDDEKDRWDTFADEFNQYTAYQLEKHSADPYNSVWGSTPGYVKLLGDSSSVSLVCGKSTYDYPTKYYTYYVKVFTDDDCLRIEHHSTRTSDGHDAVVSVSYIPYSSIAYVQANKVIE